MLRIGYTAAPAACVQEEYGKQMTVAMNQPSCHSGRASREKPSSLNTSFPDYYPKKAIGQDLQDLQDYRKSATGEHIAVGTAMCSVHPVHPV